MKSCLTLLLLIPIFATGQNLRSGGPLKPEQAIMDIRHYTIALQVDPAAKTIKGYTEIEINLSTTSPVLVLDLWHGLTVTQIWVNGRKEEFAHTQNDLLTITGAKPFVAGKQKIKVAYGGTPGVALRAPWDGGFTWSKDSKGNPWVAITCQAEGGKIFFPCKDHPSDEPNEGADLIITVPKGLSVAGPGLLQKVTHTTTTSTWHWKTTYTISNYCLVFNIGKYSKVTSTYTSVLGTKIPMEFYVLEENVDKGPHHLELLAQTCRVLEKYFGEYPWAKEKIGIAETPHLGMEHQSMNAYGNQFKYTQVGGQDFDWLLTHEFGHEWWANKVTNIDWAHMWIQEGICTYGDALYVREMEGEEAYQRVMRRNAQNAQNKKPIVQGEVVDSDDTYHSDIYGKGALFMHTLRYVIGDSIFFPTLKKLATDARYTYHNFVSTQDVEALFSFSSNMNLKPLFDFYLRTTHKLEINVKQTGEGKYAVRIVNFEGMQLPVEIVLDGVHTILKLDKAPVIIESKTLPQVDPTGFYLKRVVYE
ncbi:MAG: M1 family metallopeptidase [Cyclobacteriaceae bacterium]|nr:M1 family metallopeptidase [Cyclobacteriaceae bacterium]